MPAGGLDPARAPHRLCCFVGAQRPLVCARWLHFLLRSQPSGAFPPLRAPCAPWSRSSNPAAAGCPHHHPLALCPPAAAPLSTLLRPQTLRPLWSSPGRRPPQLLPLFPLLAGGKLTAPGGLDARSHPHPRRGARRLRARRAACVLPRRRRRGRGQRLRQRREDGADMGGGGCGGGLARVCGPAGARSRPLPLSVLRPPLSTRPKPLCSASVLCCHCHLHGGGEGLRALERRGAVLRCWHRWETRRSRQTSRP